MHLTTLVPARIVRAVLLRLLLPGLLLLLLPQAAEAQSTTFNCTGGAQTYTVPALATKLNVVATGAYNGGVVRALVTVTPGEVLTVQVGGPGKPNGPGGGGGGGPTYYGYNGGGSGGSGSYAWGGGATDLRRSGTTTGDYLTSRNALLVAGGGGGGGASFYIDAMYNGGNGGAPDGANGSASVMAYGGRGATQTAAGAGATGASAGSNNVGGAFSGSGGAGGGGYYGGGGGSSDNSNAGGGGGGSSWVMPTGSSNISYSTSGAYGDGTMTITPVVTITAAPVVTAPASGSYVATTIPIYSGTALGSSTVTVYVDGTSIGAVTATADGNWSFTQPTSLSQGSHTVRATAQASDLTVSADSNTNIFTIDTVRPTVTLSSSAGASGSTTGISPIPFTVTFSEAVTGFVTGDITVTNGTILSISGSGTTYMASLMPSSAGAVTVNVPNNVAQDRAGNGNTASATFSVTYQLPTPTLTAVSPNSAGLGQRITLTGTNLSNPTALTINGANALGNILSNSGTSLVVRVPATAASGGITITTALGTSNALTFTTLTAPGNALAFNGAGTNNNVAIPQTAQNDFTIEYWMLTTQTGLGTDGAQWYNGTGIVDAEVGGVTNDFGTALVGNKVAFGMGNPDITIQSTTVINNGRWHHVAATRSGGTFRLYIDGKLEATGTGAGTAARTAPTRITLGQMQAGARAFFTGRLDELRIWNTARNLADILASYKTIPSVPQTGLVAYYNFDAGTAGGNNIDQTTLYDLAGGNSGTLNGFTLSNGNTVSNWVESYALVVPTATAATSRTATAFTATWTAPAVGTVSSYVLEVATDAAFTAPITGSPFTLTNATSRAFNGLSATATYYYRVRADKASVTSQGGYSNTVTVCPPPVAIAQNVTLALDASGNATLAATAVNNGSSANCGPAAASTLSVSPSTFSCADVTPATVASSLAFNGVNQYISLPITTPVPVGNSQYTIEAWIKPTAMGNYGIIGWGEYGAGGQVNALRLSPSGLVNYWWGSDLIVSTPTLVGAWHHVAVTFNGTTRIMYLDGVAVGSDTPGSHTVPDARNLRIGVTNTAGPDRTEEYFRGSIDEVRVWNLGRTASQINAAKGLGLPAATPGLVVYYRLNEGSGLSVAAATGAATSRATLMNSPLWTSDAAPVVNGLPVTLTVTDASGFISTAPAVVAVSVPVTPTTTWNGSTSTTWTDCANWSFGKVPEDATSVVFPTGLARYPVLTSGVFPVKDITLTAGSSLTLNSGATLQVNGNFTNNGTAALNGNVAFVGAVATQTLSNSAGFTTVTVNKTAGTVQLGQNLTINSALTLTAGTLNTTGSYQVNLGGSASLSESETSYVTGKVAVNRLLSAGTAETFGGIGLTLTPTAASTAPGNTQVTRVTGTALRGVGNSVSIERYFDIEPSVKTGLNVAMDFAYFTHELNNIPAANLALFKSVSGLTGPWANQSPITAGTNTVRKAGITSFSIWTLGNTAAPLPVELTEFTALAKSTAVRLAWNTASERNSARFEVERSLDGNVFSLLGTVAAAGSSSTSQAYAWLDTQLPLSTNTLYYRLRQVDADGTIHFSPVRAVVLTRPATTSLTLTPNPARRTTLTGASAGATVTVYDGLGRTLLTVTADANGTATIPLPAELASGVYLVRSGLQAVRLVVE